VVRLVLLDLLEQQAVLVLLVLLALLEQEVVALQVLLVLLGFLVQVVLRDHQDLVVQLE